MLQSEFLSLIRANVNFFLKNLIEIRSFFVNCYNVSNFQIFVLTSVKFRVDVETRMITTTTQRGEIRRCMARGARWAEFNFEQPYVL